MQAPGSGSNCFKVKQSVQGLSTRGIQMELKRFRILPAALALSMMMVPVAIAGNLGEPTEKPNPSPTPPEKTPTPSSPPSVPSSGGGNSHEYGSSSIVCRIGNRSVYVASFRQCKELKYSLGYGSGYGGGSVVVQGGGQYQGGSVQGGYVQGGYGYYQPQRVIHYVARPSRAAQMQAEKRARKAARRAAQAYGNGYGYGDGGMVGYGNGVMVGGYGNNVVVNGNVYGNYAGQQVIVKQKRKHKRSRRVVYQQPIYDNGYGYDYQGPEMYKGGGY